MTRYRRSWLERAGLIFLAGAVGVLVYAAGYWAGWWQ